MNDIAGGLGLDHTVAVNQGAANDAKGPGPIGLSDLLPSMAGIAQSPVLNISPIVPAPNLGKSLASMEKSPIVQINQPRGRAAVLASAVANRPRAETFKGVRQEPVKVGGEVNIRIDSEGRPKVKAMRSSNPRVPLNVDTGLTMVAP
ncbi:MAG: hypothetical protein L0Y43_10080 [Methylococcaceae bacterium]|nr:hypothetical protein [Methylococcaceae bacterium]